MQKQEFEDEDDDDDVQRPVLLPIPKDPTDCGDLLEGDISSYCRKTLEVRRYTALIKIVCKSDNTRKAYLHHLNTYKTWLTEQKLFSVGEEMEGLLAACKPTWLEDGLKGMAVDGMFRQQVNSIGRTWESGGLVTTERAFHFLQWLADWLHGKKTGLRQCASALGFWAGIETIIRGVSNVPLIAKDVSIAAILDAADQSWIRCEIGYMPGQKLAPASPYSPPTLPKRDIQKSALSNGYTNSQFRDFLSMVVDDASRWDECLHGLQEEDRIAMGLGMLRDTDALGRIQEARSKVHDCLQTHLFAVIAHHTLSRGDTVRGFQYAHMYSRTMESVRGSKCTQLTFVANRGKTVKTGTTHHYSMVRTRDVNRCPVGAVFLWIHYLYDCVGEFRVDQPEGQGMGNVHPILICVYCMMWGNGLGVSCTVLILPSTAL